MARNYAYNNDITKWGHFSRAILKRQPLLDLLISKGLKKTDIEKVGTTEDAARQADNRQRDADRKLTSVTPKIQTLQSALLELFAEFKLRVPNVARDLKEANDEESAQAVLDLDFSQKALPRVPGQPTEESTDTEEGTTSAAKTQGETPPIETPEEEEPSEEATPKEDRDSKAQKAIANTALRLQEYLQDKPKVATAFVERAIPKTFMDDLKKQGDELLHLREERMLLLEERKKATLEEHKAVAAHIEARGAIEPTISALTPKESAIDALAVEHLGRKSAQKK